MKDVSTTRRRKLFWAITIALPIVACVGSELLLRTFHYGGNLDLVVTTEIQGKPCYTINRYVARRYFSQQGIAVPEAHDDIFEIKKRPTTKRIFMLGESTMAGFPFDYNATAPSMLHDRLQQVFPQYNIEVINVGISAINSYSVREFVSELVDYEPDAFVLYLGHNEFYGALGVGSTEYLGQSATLVNLYLKLNNLRLFRLVRDGVVKIRNVFKQDVTPRNATLMEAMVRTRAIFFDSDEYRIARRNFETNLHGIINIAKRRHVPIMLTSVVSNLRDQPPLLPSGDEHTPDHSQQRWKNLFAGGRDEQRSGNFLQAIDLYRQAIDVDSMNANAHFYLAKCLDTLSRYGDAELEYEKARDYDCMRFRASSDFNRLIRDLAMQDYVLFADAEQAFKERSPHGLVGSNLMLEHLHPNFEGYFLLAKTFFQVIIDSAVIGSDYRLNRNFSDDGYRNLSGVTEFDIEAGRYRILELTNSWPFKQSNDPHPVFTPQNHTQELAMKYVRKSIAWSDAHYELAEWYKKQGDYNRSEREFFAVSKVAPYAYYPFMQMGDMYRMMELPAEAESTYLLALSKKESPYLHVRLGMLYFDQDKTPQAIQQFETTIAGESHSAELMDKQARSMVRYFLGAAYGKTGQFEKAKVQLQSAVEIDPSNTQAKTMLAQLH